MDGQHISIELEINGIKRGISVETGTTLLEVIREQFGFKGTKRGCDNGQCGACTVIMDGKAVNACLVLAVRAQKKKIVTIEGLEPGGQLHPLQVEFEKNGAVQCGFCTSGMIMSAKSLLDSVSHPDDHEIKEAVSGNLCRCTGYNKIITAVREAARGLA